jgi:hypothetical protein
MLPVVPDPMLPVLPDVPLPVMPVAGCDCGLFIPACPEDPPVMLCELGEVVEPDGIGVCVAVAAGGGLFAVCGGIACESS